MAKLQWYRDQPGLELRENIGTGHIVAVGVKQPRANDPDPE